VQDSVSRYTSYAPAAAFFWIFFVYHGNSVSQLTTLAGFQTTELIPLTLLKPYFSASKATALWRSTNVLLLLLLLLLWSNKGLKRRIQRTAIGTLHGKGRNHGPFIFTACYTGHGCRNIYLLICDSNFIFWSAFLFTN